MSLYANDGDWRLNRIECGGPYVLWQSPAKDFGAWQVNDKHGTVALSNWRDGKRTGAVFTDKQTAEELCDKANKGLLERE